MAFSRSVIWLLASWLCTLFASTEPIAPRQGNPQNIWVTIDVSGSARTITPSISSSKTIYGAPEYVTATTVYTMTIASDIVKTSTGMAPVATATAESGAGAFVECSNYQGWDSPFCLPRRGSVLRPGSTYYVTWDPSYFAKAYTPVSIQVRFSDNTGFTTNRTILAEVGYSVWAVEETILTQEGRNGSDLVATLYLIFEQALDNSLEYAPGPEVTISKSAPSYGSVSETTTDSHRKTVAIAVPVTVLVVTSALGAVMLWRWSRRRRGFGAAKIGGRWGQKRTSSGSNHGWPEDKSHSVELANRENWAPVRGTNVFRAEIQRQEAMRGS